MDLFNLKKSRYNNKILVDKCDICNSKDKLEINFEEDNKKFFIKFKDNGPGIPHEKLEFIFDRFYKVDESRDRNILGSGLGLAITKQLCLAHGWDIVANSKIAQGSEFTIIIPKE